MVLAESDTPETRSAAAERYLKVMPVADTIEKVLPVIATQSYQSQQEEFTARIRRQINTEFLESSVKEILVKNYTTNELNALANFYGSEDGASTMKKKRDLYESICPSGFKRNSARCLMCKR